MAQPDEGPPSSFELSKWYFDAISEQGDAFVAYSATVRWRALSFRYTSVLFQPFAQPSRAWTRERSTLRSAPPPEIDGDTLSWAAPALGVSGRWTSLSAPVSETLFESSEGRVEWRCHQPRARAEITLPSSPPLIGLGYTEHVSITIPPWQLPIDKLRWGRFVSPDAGLVWIDWRGDHRRQVVLADGARIGPCRFEREGVTSEDGAVRLAFTERRDFRSGQLGKTALAVVPMVKTILPLRMLETLEQKWVSRGTLEMGGVTHHGWTLHESVSWP